MTGLVLFLLFTIIPALETWLIVKVGAQIGATETVLTLVVAGVIGAWLGKRAGFAVLRELFTDLQKGLPPADRLMEGVLVLIAAVLLITPGYFTDLVGLLLFVGPIRRLLAPPLKRLLLSWATRRGFTIGAATPGPGWAGPTASHAPPAEPPRAGRRFEHPVQ